MLVRAFFLSRCFDNR